MVLPLGRPSSCNTSTRRRCNELWKGYGMAPEMAPEIELSKAYGAALAASPIEPFELMKPIELTKPIEPPTTGMRALAASASAPGAARAAGRLGMQVRTTAACLPPTAARAAGRRPAPTPAAVTLTPYRMRRPSCSCPPSTLTSTLICAMSCSRSLAGHRRRACSRARRRARHLARRARHLARHFARPPCARRLVRHARRRACRRERMKWCRLRCPRRPSCTRSRPSCPC